MNRNDDATVPGAPDPPGPPPRRRLGGLLPLLRLAETLFGSTPGRVFLLTLAVVTAVSFFVLHVLFQEASYEGIVAPWVRETVELVRRTVEISMLEERSHRVGGDLRSLLRRHPRIEAIDVTGPRGLVLFSTRPEATRAEHSPLLAHATAEHSARPYSRGGSVHDMQDQVAVARLDVRQACQRCHDEPLGAPLGTVAVRVRSAGIVDRVQEALRSSLRVVVLAVLILAVVLAVYVQRRLVEPTRRLARHMRLLGGQEPRPLPPDVRLPAELQPVVDAYNKGVQRLAEVQEEVRKLERERLAQLDRLATVGQLSASVAHEIRNPLAGISGAVRGLVADLELGAEHQEIAEEIHRQIQRLTRTVTNLLEYGRPEEPSLARVRPAAVIERTLMLMLPGLLRHSIQVESKVDEATPDVLADEGWVMQILINAILNADQAMDEPGNLIVRARRSPTRKDRVVISVTDDGPGMSPEVVARACQPFFSTRTEGTGLGLAIARDLAEKMDGSLDITSTVGEGTAVSLSLPVADGARREAGPIGGSRKAQIVGSRPRGAKGGPSGFGQVRAAGGGDPEHRRDASASRGAQGADGRSKRATPGCNATRPDDLGKAAGAVGAAAAMLLLGLLGAAPAQAGDRPGGSCTAGSCHKNLVARGNLHEALDDGCDTCHDPVKPLPAGGKHGPKAFKPIGDLKEVCGDCHDDVEGFEDRAAPHDPAAEAECTECHDPHSSPHDKLLRKPVPKLCFGCHDEPVNRHRYLHGPMGVGDCTACHDPHGGVAEPILKQAQPDLCLRCHDDLRKRLDGARLHPPVQKCTACHNPHGGAIPRFLAARGKALCAKCHKALVTHSTAASKQHPPVRKGCPTCHDPHGTENRKLLLQPQVELCGGCHKAVAGQAAGAAVKHRAITLRGCAGCHNPHGSDHDKLLLDDFPVSKLYAPCREGTYKLCFRCHKPAMLDPQSRAPSTGFRAGQKNLHAVHVVDARKGRTCALCHAPHGSSQDHLLRREVPFGSSGWKLTIAFTPRRSGGKCTVACHEPREYKRAKAVKTPKRGRRKGPAKKRVN